MVNIRIKLFPSLKLSAEQFFFERDIDIMHSNNGYSLFSERLRSYIPTNSRVLDLGCNRGLETSIIAKTNEVVGIDLYKTFVRSAIKKGINAIVMNFDDLTFKEEFDCVYSNNTLEHTTHPEKVVSGVYRALKPGGVFIIGMPLDGNNPNIKDPAHFFRAKKDDVVSLLQNNNFDIQTLEIINTKNKWNWSNPPANDEMIIAISKKRL